MNDQRLQGHKLGYLELAEKPSAQVLSAYYEKTYFQNESANYRKRYSTLEIEIIRLRITQRAAMVHSLTGPKAPGRMLDVGCGEGFVISHYSSLGWQVSGIDFSRAGVDLMNPDCATFVEQGDVFRLLEDRIAAGEKNDLIWLGNVLEHVLDPCSLLQSLRSALSPDGLLVVTVPNDGNDYHEALFERGDIPERFWIAIPDHISYFTAKSLKRVATATGWECLAMQGDFPIDFYLAHEGSNYVVDKSRGPAAHQSRLLLEQQIGKAGLDAANQFYEALAGVGLGRNITAYLRPITESQEI